MKRGRAWRRYKDYTKARRKRNIDAAIYAGNNCWYPWYNNLHQYSKNKIHCSCPMCSTKTTNKTARHSFYSPAWNPRLTDLRKELAMDDSEWDYLVDTIIDIYCNSYSNRHNRRRDNW